MQMSTSAVVSTPQQQPQAPAQESHVQESQAAIDGQAQSVGGFGGMGEGGNPLSGKFPPTSMHGGWIQAKLEIGAVDDPLEREADAMADKVMRMPLSGAEFAGISSPVIQRKCADCEQEDEKLQRKSVSNNGGGFASPQLSSQITSTRGGGLGLDTQTRGFMENGFGRDFSSVKIHTGSYAGQMNRDLNARAFTIGNDIYFNQGQYQPASESGRRLLAHELTHVVQQRGGNIPLVQRAPPGDPRHVVGEIGELLVDQFLDDNGYYVFRDWSKKVNAGGFDSIAYNPKTKQLLWIDNKAYTGTISGASALEANYAANRLAAIEFLKTQTGPEALAALEAIGKNEVKLIANGMSGANAKAAAGIFQRGIMFLDVYARKFSTTYAAYLEMRTANEIVRIAAAKGYRIRRQGGFATIGTMGFIAIAGLTAGIILTSSDRVEAIKDLAVGMAVDATLTALFMRVGGASLGVASLLTMVVSMESDNASLNEARAKYRMIEKFICTNLRQYCAEYYTDYWLWQSDYYWRGNDTPEYFEVHEKIEKLFDNPYELEPIEEE